MGTDITLIVEERVSDPGRWQPALRKNAEDDSDLSWYDDRHYECFSLLTGLDFSARHVRPVEPVSPVRGFPSDISEEGLAYLLRYTDSSTFGRSWLSIGELLSYDWDAIVTWTYMASPSTPGPFSDDIRRHVQGHAERTGRPPPGWGVAGWSRDGFEVTGRISRRELAGRFSEVIDDMAELAERQPDTVRCIFEFDR